MAAIATGAGLGWSASANAATIPTTVEIGGYGYDLDVRAMNGQVFSARRACVRNRTTDLLAKSGSRFRRFSQDVSSDNGFFGGDGTQSGGPPTKFKVVVRRKRLGRNRVCSGASDTATTPSGPGGLARTTFPTSIGLLTAGSGDSVSALGVITARKACRKDRRVAIIALRSEGNETIDVDHASDNGYFGGGGPAPDSEGVRVSAPAKPLGDGDQCAAASDEAA